MRVNDCKNKIVTLAQMICCIKINAQCKHCVTYSTNGFLERLKVEMCTYLQPISNNYIEKGVSQSQERMNIQQEVGCVKKGWVRKSIKDKYPTAMSKRGGSER